MSELAKLIAQRDELNKKIKEIEDSQMKAGHAMLKCENYARKSGASGKNTYYLCFASMGVDTQLKSNFKSIMSSEDRSEVVSAIPLYIRDLRELYMKATGNAL